MQKTQNTLSHPPSESSDKPILMKQPYLCHDPPEAGCSSDHDILGLGSHILHTLAIQVQQLGGRYGQPAAQHSAHSMTCSAQVSTTTKPRLSALALAH